MRCLTLVSIVIGMVSAIHKMTEGKPETVTVPVVDPITGNTIISGEKKEQHPESKEEDLNPADNKAEKSSTKKKDDCKDKRFSD